MHFARFLLVLPVGLLAVRAAADEVRYVEKDGVTYQETRRVIRRPVSETNYEQREQIVHRNKYTTDYQPSDRTYLAPVTEYRWEPHWVNPWNPFSSPYLTYRWVPVTKWVERHETVRVPITRREVVPEKVTTSVPVTTQRYVEDEYISRVAVKAPPGTTTGGDSYGNGQSSVARREPIGGIRRLESDPPRDGAWRPAESIRR